MRNKLYTNPQKLRHQVLLF